MSTEKEHTKTPPEEPRASSASTDEGPDGSGSCPDDTEGASQSDDTEGETEAWPEDYLEIKAKAEERDRFLDELKRARADLENFQRRTRRERAGLEKQGARRVLAELLGVVDNFERALASLDTDGARSGLEEGVRMIHQQLEQVLRNQGVTEIAALGETFNPEYHEAVTQEEVEDRPTGEIVKVLQRGYLHENAVLRPTAVKVALNVADRTSPDDDGATEGATDEGAAGTGG